MEIFGLSLIIPIVSLLLNNNIYGLNPYLDSFLRALNNPDINQILLIALGTFVTFYLFKSIFTTYLIYKQNSFLSYLKAKISKLIFETYLYKDYSFFLDMKSSEILRNIRRETDLFLEVVVQAIIVLITELFIVVGILSLLFYFQPLGSFSIILIVILTIYLHRFFTKKITYQYGKKRQDSESLCIEVIQQSLSSIISIKLKKIEDQILKIFNIHAQEEADSQRFQATMQELPRLWLELISIIGLSIFIIIMQYEGYNSAETIGVLAIFAGAAFKILPSMNRIFTSIQKLRYGNPIMKTMNEIYVDYNKLKLTQKTDNQDKINKISKDETKNFLDIKKLNFRYSYKKNYVFKDLSFSIRENDKIGITGESGSGKSTLVNLILGLLIPEQGEILFKSESIQEVKSYYHENIAYVPQNIFLLNNSIINNITFGEQGKVDDMRLEQAIKVSQLDLFIKELPDDLETLVSENSGNISGGQKQRIGLARAIYSNPKFLLLDEATSALDSISEKEILKSIFNINNIKNIVLISHKYENFNLCNKVFKISQNNLKKLND
jgi:ATP-binding cassette, subfamily B, bacterial PglK